MEAEEAARVAEAEAAEQAALTATPALKNQPSMFCEENVEDIPDQGGCCKSTSSSARFKCSQNSHGSSQAEPEREDVLSAFHQLISRHSASQQNYYSADKMSSSEAFGTNSSGSSSEANNLHAAQNYSSALKLSSCKNSAVKKSCCQNSANCDELHR